MDDIVQAASQLGMVVADIELAGLFSVFKENFLHSPSTWRKLFSTDDSEEFFSKYINELPQLLDNESLHITSSAKEPAYGNYPDGCHVSVKSMVTARAHSMWALAVLKYVTNQMQDPLQNSTVSITLGKKLDRSRLLKVVSHSSDERTKRELLNLGFDFLPLSGDDLRVPPQVKLHKHLLTTLTTQSQQAKGKLKRKKTTALCGPTHASSSKTRAPLFISPTIAETSVGGNTSNVCLDSAFQVKDNSFSSYECCYSLSTDASRSLKPIGSPSSSLSPPLLGFPNQDPDYPMSPPPKGVFHVPIARHRHPAVQRCIDMLRLLEPGALNPEWTHGQDLFWSKANQTGYICTPSIASPSTASSSPSCEAKTELPAAPLYAGGDGSSSPSVIMGHTHNPYSLEGPTYP